MNYDNFQILVDQPTANPALNFDPAARGLSSVILHSPPQFSMAVFGPWGSGKTTLMKAIARDLELNASKATLTVDFSAWRYEKEEHLIIPLLDTIRDTLVQQANRWQEEANAPSGNRTLLNSMAESSLKTAKTVGNVIASVLAGVSFKFGFPGALEMSYDASKALASNNKTKPRDREGTFSNDEKSFQKRLGDPELFQSFYHVCFKALSKSFEEFEQVVEDNLGETLRIVVFVDDLDRCLPKATLEVLESMKLFFDLAGFIFVVGLDRKVVEASIDHCYLEGSHHSEKSTPEDSKRPLVNGRDYLKKIFQVPYSLSRVSRTLIYDLISSISNNGTLPQEQKDDLLSRIAWHVEYLFPQDDDSHNRLNPREVKRYINAYTIQMKINEHLDPDIVLGFNTLSFRLDCANLLNAINAAPRPFILNLKEFLNEPEDTSPLEDYDLKLSDVPNDIRRFFATPQGSKILDEPELETYLLLGESTRSSSGGLMLDLLPQFHRMRRNLKQTVYAPDPAEINHLWDTAVKDFYGLSEQLRSNISEGNYRRMERVSKWILEKDSNADKRRFENALNEYNNSPTDETEESLSNARKQLSEEIKINLDILYDILKRVQSDAVA